MYCKASSISGQMFVRLVGVGPLLLELDLTLSLMRPLSWIFHLTNRVVKPYKRGSLPG